MPNDESNKPDQEGEFCRIMRDLGGDDPRLRQQWNKLDPPTQEHLYAGVKTLDTTFDQAVADGANGVQTSDVLREVGNQSGRVRQLLLEDPNPADWKSQQLLTGYSQQLAAMKTVASTEDGITTHTVAPEWIVNANHSAGRCLGHIAETVRQQQDAGQTPMLQEFRNMAHGGLGDQFTASEAVNRMREAAERRLTNAQRAQLLDREATMLKLPQMSPKISPREVPERRPIPERLEELKTYSGLRDGATSSPTPSDADTVRNKVNDLRLSVPTINTPTKSPRISHQERPIEGVRDRVNALKNQQRSSSAPSLGKEIAESNIDKVRRHDPQDTQPGQSGPGLSNSS